MSSFSAWSYTSDLTFWPVTFDKFSQPVAGAPVVIKGTWVEGGRAAQDDAGVEFMPQCRYYFESTPAAAPRRTWRVLRGIHVGAPPVEAETIRTVRSFDDTTFGDDSPPDYEVLT